MAAFAVLRGLLMAPVGTVGPFWPGDSPFRTVCVCVGRGGGRVCELCPGSRAWRASPLPSGPWPAGGVRSSGLYPAGGLQWRFACGFSF